MITRILHYICMFSIEVYLQRAKMTIPPIHPFYLNSFGWTNWPINCFLVSNLNWWQYSPCHNIFYIFHEYSTSNYGKNYPWRRLIIPLFLIFGERFIKKNEERLHQRFLHFWRENFLILSVVSYDIRILIKIIDLLLLGYYTRFWCSLRK